MKARELCLIVLLVAALALVAAPAVERLAVHLVDTAATRPESVSGAIAASRQAVEPAAGIPGWLVALALVGAAGFLAGRAGELLRQLRLARRRRNRAAPRPLSSLPELAAQVGQRGDTQVMRGDTQVAPYEVEP